MQPGQRVWLPKPGRTTQRPFSVQAVRDRIAQAPLKLVAELAKWGDIAAAGHRLSTRIGQVWEVQGTAELVRYDNDLEALCRSPEETKHALALLHDVIGELGTEFKVERYPHLAPAR